MNNVIGKLQTCIFLNDTDIKYLKELAPKILDTDRPRKLYCNFESTSKKDAKKLCSALQRIGFEAYIDDIDDKIVEATKVVSYTNSKHALNLAMYEAWKHRNDSTTLMLEQDIVPTKQTNDKQS